VRRPGRAQLFAGKTDPIRRYSNSRNAANRQSTSSSSRSASPRDHFLHRGSRTTVTDGCYPEELPPDGVAENLIAPSAGDLTVTIRGERVRRNSTDNPVSMTGQALRLMVPL
jgi:hypothetical protein